MKTPFLLAILFFYSVPASSQVELSASMGIDFLNSPSMNDYINLNHAPASDRLADFNAAVIFSLEGGYFISDSYQFALETAYLINSYTRTDLGGKYEISYGVLMPSLLNYYVIGGEGYNFKFGGGLGIRFVTADETSQGITKTYTSTGYGFLLRAEGNTLLDGNIYAKIGAQLRYDLNGEPDNNGDYLNDVSQEKVNFNTFSVGLSLGIAYIF
jgi:hypothetical protein